MVAAVATLRVEARLPLRTVDAASFPRNDATEEVIPVELLAITLPTLTLSPRWGVFRPCDPEDVEGWLKTIASKFRR